jgi:hypothetical protein
MAFANIYINHIYKRNKRNLHIENIGEITNDVLN